MALPGNRTRGPWWHRFLIHLFTVILVALIYWVQGFLLDDLGHWPPPDHDAIVREFVPEELSQKVTRLKAQFQDLLSQANQVRRQQTTLQDSTANSQRTMQQITELEQLRLQKNEPPNADQQQAMSTAGQQFLKNQQEYQAKTEELARLEGEEARTGLLLAAAERELAFASIPAEQEYHKQYQRWELLVAVFKVGLMLPFVVAAAWLFWKYRGGMYGPLVNALGIAVGLKLLVVMHAYFPALYFKYIFIIAAIFITVWLLIGLLRMVARPRTAWLLKQYREAYAVFLCPVCEFPIRRGPLKYLSWTRRSIKRLHDVAASSEPDAPYTCPACSTPLFEECEKCHAVRHSLLPACCQCGDEKELNS